MAFERQFSGAYCMLTSFGYFDDPTNEHVLRQMAARLHPGGRALIDLYNRDHIATLPLVETYERVGTRVNSTRSWSGPRHKVELAYGGGGRDEFEWRLYTPNEFTALAAAAGLRARLACAWFRESLAPGAEHARMQFVLEPVRR
jgi:SAM-dependent methyltransferase